MRQAAAASPTATRVLNAAEQAGARVTVLDDKQFSARYKGAAAIYDHGTKQIVIPRRALASPAQAVLTLVHEGVHFLDDQTHDTGAAGASQAVTGARGVRANFTGLAEGSNAFSWATEAHSYVVEASVAQELGIRDTGLGTNPNGTLRTYDQTYNVVRNHPLYR